MKRMKAIFSCRNIIFFCILYSLTNWVRAEDNLFAQSGDESYDDVIITDPQVLIRALPILDTASVSLITPPSSRRLYSGYVCLLPGQSGKEHSTENYEEMILILDGAGELHHLDRNEPVSPRHLAYIPPHTKHFLRNTGPSMLRYMYIVTRVEP
jgi:quercetin dioxygenase-like cupin family protein